MARGTTWTYKPKGPPLRMRVVIRCAWPECPKPDVASWRPRSAKVRAKLSRYTYCSRSHAQKDWRRREHEKWLAAQPPYQCAYLPCHNELWLTGEPGRPRDYCTPEHKAAAQRDRERRQPGGAVERATQPALFALQRAADAWQRAVGARIDLARWVATNTPPRSEPVTEADLLRRFEADKRAYPEALRRFEADQVRYDEELRRFEEKMSRHEEELTRFEELRRIQDKHDRWRQSRGEVAAEVDRRRGRPLPPVAALKFTIPRSGPSPMDRLRPDLSIYGLAQLLGMTGGPTPDELDALDGWQPSQPLQPPQLPQPPQPPQLPQLQELPPPEPEPTLSPWDAQERDRQQAKVDELEDVAAAHTRRALELGAGLRSARERLARRAETARLRRATAVEAEDVDRRRDDPGYDA